MSTLSASLSSAITKSLLTQLPAAAAAKFNLEEEEFKTFLQEFLSTQLGKSAKSGRAAGPKGTDGKGRITGYILFCGEHRESVKEAEPDLKFTEVGKKLGEMWGELSDADKDNWNAKAKDQNAANGLTPAPARGEKKAAGEKKPAAKAGAKGGAKKGKPAAEADSSEMKITRNQDAKAWVVQGTSFVVQSPTKKVVVGKLRDGKVVALSTADRKKCEGENWDVAPAKEAAVEKAPASKAGAKAGAKGVDKAPASKAGAKKGGKKAAKAHDSDDEDSDADA